MKNIYCRLFVLILAFVTFICACDSNKIDKVERKKIGNHLIEAVFINDSIVDGIARYYDNDENLIGIAKYKKGLKEGYAINYYKNKVVRDSLYFSNGLLNGFGFGYDSLGNLLYKKTYYYGISMGHRYYYTSGRLNKYFYSDFNKNVLINCEYDSLKKTRLLSFNNMPILTEGLDDQGRPALGLFLYFPKPPGLTVIYKIGLTNDKQETKNESVLQDDRLFLDTIITYPREGWHYYISTEIRNSKDSINKVYIQDLKTY